MKKLGHSNLQICAIAVSLLVSVGGLHANAFQNLDFEMATVSSAPADYAPFDAYPPISAANALPYWTVREDTSVCTAVWGAPMSLDETSVALVTGNDYPFVTPSPLQGDYSVQLYAWADAPSTYFHSASISQTGLVPAGMRSIQFLMQSPAVAGGVVQANPTVTLNSTPINMVAISKAAGIVTMAGDISAFAGTTANLSIQCAGISGTSINLSENIFELDAITFSSMDVPEPNTSTLMFLTGLIVLFLGVRECPKSLPAVLRITLAGFTTCASRS